MANLSFDEFLEKEGKIKLDKKLLDFIEEKQKNGISKGDIKEFLIKAGYSSANIDYHFNLAVFKHKNPNILKYLLTLFILISILSVAANIVFYFKLSSSKTYNDLVSDSKELCSQGNYDKAFKKLEKAMRLDNKNAFAYGIYGHCYLLQGKYEEAIRVLNVAVAKEPAAPLYFYRLGLAYCSLGNYNLGIANLLKSIQLNPTNPDFHKAAADCYSKAGNKEEADRQLAMINGTIAINNI